MSQSEIRQNKATREWVIYSPARAMRPDDFKRVKKRREPLPVHDKTCPFCPGNESKLPAILLELHRPGNGDWQTRVVNNKFPALFPEQDTVRVQKDIYLSMAGFGRHEVILESPRHNQTMALMSVEQVRTVIETYHRRYLNLMKQHENMLAIIFRNHGRLAGTSLMHPHSQIIVTGMVPRDVRWRELEAQRYFDEWGRCVYCDILKHERELGVRVLLENDTFIAFVPFAAEVPFEVWIIPKRHQADFGSIEEREKDDLAAALRDILARIHQKLGDPDYNYVVNTAAQYRSDEPQLHWYLQIRPRLVTRAGFEIGSGMSINPSVPERDADYLNM